MRIQVRLDTQDFDLVKREARASGVSIAEYVRRAIRQVLPARTEAPWMRYAGLVESGHARSSQTVDDVVYASLQERKHYLPQMDTDKHG